MPIFSVPEVNHPNPLLGRCFAIQVVLPPLPGTKALVDAFLGFQFDNSLISAELAKRLSFQVDGKTARGKVVFETRFEGEPSIHRTRPLDFKFRLAVPKAGDLYIHFAMDDISDYFASRVFRSPSVTQVPFMGLRPEENESTFCVVLPIER